MKHKNKEIAGMKAVRDLLDGKVSKSRHLDNDALRLLAHEYALKHEADEKRAKNTSRVITRHWYAILVPAAALAVILLAGLPGMRSKKSAFEAAAITAEMIIPASTEWVTGAFSGNSEASYIEDYIEDLWGSNSLGIIF